MDYKTTFSGFSTNDIMKAKEFYTEILGCKLMDESMGLHLELPGGVQHFIYEKPDHQPATYTALNFVVDDIDAVADELIQKGVTFDRPDNVLGELDEKGIMHSPDTSKYGPSIAWFKDPAGNVLSVLEN